MVLVKRSYKFCKRKSCPTSQICQTQVLKTTMFLHIMKLGYALQKIQSKVFCGQLHTYTSPHIFSYIHNYTKAYTYIFRNICTHRKTNTQIQDELSEDWAVLINLYLAGLVTGLYFIINKFFYFFGKRNYYKTLQFFNLFLYNLHQLFLVDIKKKKLLFFPPIRCSYLDNMI